MHINLTEILVTRPRHTINVKMFDYQQSFSLVWNAINKYEFDINVW